MLLMLWWMIPAFCFQDPGVRIAPRTTRLEASRGGLRVLEWIPSQQLLVRSAKFAWREAWKTMMAELAPQSTDGDYVRPAPQVGSSTPSLATGRFALYVGNACPWCHRAVLALALRQASNVEIVELEDDAGRASRGGWVVKSGRDVVFQAADLKTVYDRASKGGYRGRCTAPLLVDASRGIIAASDSADIARALAADDVVGNDVDLRPSELAREVDSVCAFMYENVNDAVYRCGFCTTQDAYERAEATLHDALTSLDDRLSSSRFVCADRVTLADVWLYPTAARFDAVYAPLFRCGRKRLVDYPNLRRWQLDFEKIPGVARTVDVSGAARSYYSSLFPLNPSGIVPALPDPAPVVDNVVHDDDSVFFKLKGGR